MTTEIKIPTSVYAELKRHLLPLEQQNEEAAFIFANVESTEDRVSFVFKELYKLMPDDYQIQLPYHFELADRTRAYLIKRAHELNSSLIEFHSHLNIHFAEFSVTDQEGFHEFVPHVFWRLRQKPYAAVVMTPRAFDALVWVYDPHNPVPLNAIVAGNQAFTPTNRTINPSNYG